MTNLKKTYKNYQKKWKHDSIYKSMWFYKFLNCSIKNGEKKKITLSTYKVCYKIQQLYSISFIYFFFELLEISKPLLYVESGRHTGNRNRSLPDRRQIPAPILNNLPQYKFAIKQITQAIETNNDQKKNTIENRIISIVNFKNNIKFIKKKTILYNNVVKNRMFLRFRWRTLHGIKHI